MSHRRRPLRIGTNRISRHVYELQDGDVKNVAEFEVARYFLGAGCVQGAGVDLAIKGDDADGMAGKAGESDDGGCAPEGADLEPGVGVDDCGDYLAGVVHARFSAGNDCAKLRTRAVGRVA